MDATQWDQRYARDGYAYGTDPNAFLASVADRLPPGPVLMLGEGEGRNAVFLAQRGHAVTAVDQSAVGLAKARRLAEARGVRLETVQADLASYTIAPGAWAVIVSIFCHLPPEIRKPLHARVVQGLRIGGALVLEAYTPAQLGRGTGGPARADMLLSETDVRGELAGLAFDLCRETEREVVEGAFHTGRASVVQALGWRRAAG